MLSQHVFPIYLCFFIYYAGRLEYSLASKKEMTITSFPFNNSL